MSIEELIDEVRVVFSAKIAYVSPEYMEEFEERTGYHVVMDGDQPVIQLAGNLYLGPAGDDLDTGELFMFNENAKKVVLLRAPLAAFFSNLFYWVKK